MSATPASVSRLLSAGGMTKSKSWSTRIKGWKEHSTGFATHKTLDVIGGVTVYWKESSLSRGRDTSLPNMVRAAEILRAKGYTVEPATFGEAKRSILLVTKPAPRPAPVEDDEPYAGLGTV